MRLPVRYTPPLDT